MAHQYNPVFPFSQKHRIVLVSRRSVGIYCIAYRLSFPDSAIIGIVGTEASNYGRCLLGFVGMVGDVLLVVVLAQTVDVAGEGAEAALEGERDVGAAQLTVLHHVIDLQVRIELGELLLYIGRISRAVCSICSLRWSS